MAVQITLIGLGQIGTSIGLALAEHKQIVRRVGHDPEPTTARQAEKLGAVDQVVFNLPASVRQADLVVLALPVDEIKDTLKYINQDLKDGTVIIDTSPNKAAVAGWAAELIPAGRYFVSWTPGVKGAYLEESPAGAAHADLFRDNVVFITTAPGIPNQAIKLATDLVTLLGATPLFADEAEVDGLAAASQILPQLAAAALLNATIPQPGWREGRKTAGPAYASATAPITLLTEKTKLGQAALLNQVNTLRMVDELIAQLREVRTAIANQDAKTLQSLLDQAVNNREQWMGQRYAANWQNESLATNVEMPRTADILGRLIGLGRKPGKDKK